MKKQASTSPCDWMIVFYWLSHTGTDSCKFRTEYLIAGSRKSCHFTRIPRSIHPINQFSPSLSVVGMLKSLHQLQEENRRLEEQIKTLTMKKERLQLLSAQLSVPFTPSTASSGKQQTYNSKLMFSLSISLLIIFTISR